MYCRYIHTVGNRQLAISYLGVCMKEKKKAAVVGMNGAHTANWLFAEPDVTAATE